MMSNKIMLLLLFNLFILNSCVSVPAAKLNHIFIDIDGNTFQYLSYSNGKQTVKNITLDDLTKITATISKQDTNFICYSMENKSEPPILFKIKMILDNNKIPYHVTQYGIDSMVEEQNYIENKDNIKGVNTQLFWNDMRRTSSDN